MLTVAVQVGFAVGALAIAVQRRGRCHPAHRLIAIGALVAAVANAASRCSP